MDSGCFPAPPASADPDWSLLGPSWWLCVAVSGGAWPLLGSPEFGRRAPRGNASPGDSATGMRSWPALSSPRAGSRPHSGSCGLVAGGDQRQVRVSSEVVLGGGQRRPCLGVAPHSASLTALQSWLASQPIHKTFPGCALCPGHCHSAVSVNETQQSQLS